MKRVGTFLLALIMVFSLAMPAAAAEKATATTMRLMETEGTATVKNAAGKSLSVKDNMRLYNGYEVATKAKSYAYISLDSSKAVKLDASSAGEIAKSGRQLELKLTSGKMFFNVPVALEADESMEIRTSTMMMGIRGTAGWVEVLDRYTTRIGVLEGMVTIHSQHPLTGADRSVTITGGQTATIIRHERAQAMMQELIRQGVIIEDNIVEELTEIGQIVEELREDGIPGFTAAEVADDTDLRQRINEESPLDADKIAQNAAAKLAADEAAAKRDAEEVQESTTAVGMKNLFGEVRTEVVTQTTTVTVTVPGETEYVPTGLNNPTTEAVQEVLNEDGIAAVTNVGSQFDITRLEMKATDTLYIIGGSVEIPEGTAWTTNGYVGFFGFTDITNYGTINVASLVDMLTGTRFQNSGTLNINDDLYFDGRLMNSGSIVIGNGGSEGYLQAMKNSAIWNGENGGRVSAPPAPTFVVETGMFFNMGAFWNYNPLTNNDEICSWGTIKSYNTLINNGTFVNGQNPYIGGESLMYAEEEEDNGANAVMINDSRIQNNGALENYASFYNNYSGGYSRSTDSMYGITNSGSLLNYGYFNNDSGSIAAVSAEGTTAKVAAIEMYGGVLEMQWGQLHASGDNVALFYEGGGLIMDYGAEITHEGSGSGCAVLLGSMYSAGALRNVQDVESDRTSNNYGRLCADTIENLIKVNDDEFSLETGCDANYHDPESVIAVGVCCFPYVGSAEEGYIIYLDESYHHVYL